MMRKRWLRWAVAGTVAVGAAAAGILRYAAVQWNAATDELRERLRTEAARSRLDTPQDPKTPMDLPGPVARYFRKVLPEGQPPIAHARIHWTGHFNMGKPGADRWVPFTAVQDFYPGAPGMIWDARMWMAPGVTVRVRDGFVHGSGSMYGAVLGLIPVVDVAGTPAISRAALQRYLAEAAWFPTALLPEHGVSWTTVSDSVARATLRAGATTASVDFRFGEEGLVESTFVPDRMYDDGRSAPEPHPWQGRNLSYGAHDGLVVPADAVVEWLLPAAPYQYWRGRPARIEYSYTTQP